METEGACSSQLCIPGARGEIRHGSAWVLYKSPSLPEFKYAPRTSATASVRNVHEFKYESSLPDPDFKCKKRIHNKRSL